MASRFLKLNLLLNSLIAISNIIALTVPVDTLKNVKVEKPVDGSLYHTCIGPNKLNHLKRYVNSWMKY